MESTEKENPRKEEEARQPVSLSDDLVMEILVRLPFRSLVRFQCVSKSWRSLTYDARKKLPRRPHGFFHRSIFRSSTVHVQGIRFVNTLEDTDDVDTALTFLPPSLHFDDVDVCNGLLLCRLSEYSLRYLVLNPATRKYEVLPSYNVGFFQLRWLAFDPDVSPHYNVLSLAPLAPTPFTRLCAYHVAIFSSKDHAWVVAEERIELDNTFYESHCHIFFDGVLYVLVGMSVVLVFNLQEKVCRRLELPDGALDPDQASSSYRGLCFGAYGGCLQIAGTMNDEIVVWELKCTETNKWVLKHTTSVHAMEEKLGGASVLGYDKFLLRSFHFEADAILLTAGSSLFCYDLSTTNMTKVCALRDGNHNQSFNHTFVYPYTPYYSED